MTTLFLDSDGVFADFDTHFEQSFGRPTKGLGDAALWAMINGKEDWWETMPLMAGAQELWAVVQPLSPIVLTGCPKSNYQLAAQEKRKWWARHFDHNAVITCLSKDKATHMRAEGDVLIDDMYKNIKRWREAGGIGIFHRNNEETLAALAKHGVI
jgi:hypothetical protein